VLEDENKLAIAEGLTAMAKRIGCSTAQLALAWMMRRSEVCVIPIIGARKLSQLTDNLGAAEVELTGAEIAEVDAMTALVPEYPHSLYASEFFQTMMYGEVRDRIQLNDPWQ
jgi:aryl-alcohol dehydrogenase-like predicted oxidoreductase